MKHLLIVFLSVVFLSLIAIPALAQSPLPGVPLAPAPPIGTPLAKAPEAYAPTWQATVVPPPPPAPTVTPTIWNVVALAPVPVHMSPSLNSYVLTTLPTGTVVAVRWAGPGWLQLESGYASGSYIQDSAPIQRV